MTPSSHSDPIPPWNFKKNTCFVGKTQPSPVALPVQSDCDLSTAGQHRHRRRGRDRVRRRGHGHGEVVPEALGQRGSFRTRPSDPDPGSGIRMVRLWGGGLEWDWRA